MLYNMNFILITFLIYFTNLFVPFCSLDSTEPTSVTKRTYDYYFISQLSNSQRDVMEEIISLNLSNEETLIKLAFLESTFRPEVRKINQSINHYSVDRGLFQINSLYHPDVSDECAFSVECSARWTNNMIEAGEGHQWSTWDKLKLFN